MSTAALALAALLGSSPKSWQFKSGDAFDVLYTSPKNALATAKMLRESEYRGFGKVAGRELARDAKAQLSAQKLATLLSRRARRAAKTPAPDLVAFRTESGGYPWRGSPFLWTRS